MSTNEMAENALLGALLLLVFALLFAAGFGALGLAFYGLELAVKRFIPGLALSRDLQFYGLLCLLSIISGITHLRKRHWPNAFLSFAVISVIASVWSAGTHSALVDLPFPWIWFLVIAVSVDASLKRIEFMVGAFVISATFAVNAGLLGTGTLARIAVDCAIIGMLGLCVQFVIRVRRRGYSPDSQSASPANA